MKNKSAISDVREAKEMKNAEEKSEVITILVIEDSSYFRNMLRIMIRNSDRTINLLEAENGTIGVQLALEHLPNLIISDIIMPELDGYAVLNTLRQEPTTQSIPFIFLSSRGEKSAQRYGMDLGADDYLTKPFTKQELLRAISARLKKHEIVHKQSQKQLDELRDSLSYSLPHELHTPLTGILGLSRVLLDAYELEDPRVVKMIQTIHDSAQNLYRLTQNFLLYANLEMLSQDPDSLEILTSFSEITFTREVIENVAQQIHETYQGQRKLLLVLEHDNSITLSAHKLDKILEEIIDNAFKFSELGTSIYVKSHSDDRYLYVEVINSGKGMSVEQIKQIGAYVQFHRRLYEQQGSGLGLIVAKRLTELYGGRLTISSIPHQQTIVQICLPKK